jgi:hypothetical protein
MATTTNYGWTTPNDTDLVKNGASAIRSLGTAIDTTVFTNAGNAVQKSVVDAAGDLLIGTADNTVGRLAIGTASQQLRVNSGATSLEYFTPTASGGMTLISEQAVSAVTSVTFGSIAQTYKQLYLVWSGIRHSTSGSAYTIRLNNNSNTIYRTAFVGFDQATIQNQDENATSIGGSGNYPSFGSSANGNQVRYDACGYLVIDNYASTTRPKFVIGNWWFRHSTDGVNRWAAYNGIFDDTTAITSIDVVRLTGSATITNNNNSSIRLYGIS